MDLQQFKQLDSEILGETNVKELLRTIGYTEKGALELVFNRERQEYYWRLGDERVMTPTPKLDERIGDILAGWYMRLDMAKKKITNKKTAKKGTGIVLRVGRPKSFDEAEEFFAACHAYFKSLRFYNKPNIAGLCLFLGISRETWYDYKKKRKEFSDTVRAVEQAIESVWIDKLGSSYATGAIFYLKNFKPDVYKDRLSGDPDAPLTMQITGMKVSLEKK